ncbi:Cation-transporting ATPase [Mycena venus]|uniref:Cation-transporting ATPase n=1 Tax=Mycena venus TaxID=2733690 RepID=A0A8H6Z343_9AGAR|nr:Cation-transporting ATPase [Mycena venus]
MSSGPPTYPFPLPAVVNAAEWNNSTKISRYNSPTEVVIEIDINTIPLEERMEFLRTMSMGNGQNGNGNPATLEPGTTYKGGTIFNGAEVNNSRTIDRRDSKTTVHTRISGGRPSNISVPQTRQEFYFAEPQVRNVCSRETTEKRDLKTTINFGGTASYFVSQTNMQYQGQSHSVHRRRRSGRGEERANDIDEMDDVPVVEYERRRHETSTQFRGQGHYLRDSQNSGHRYTNVSGHRVDFGDTAPIHDGQYHGQGTSSQSAGQAHRLRDLQDSGSRYTNVSDHRVGAREGAPIHGIEYHSRGQGYHTAVARSPSEHENMAQSRGSGSQRRRVVAVAVDSPEIARASLHVRLPFIAHLYALPFLSLYPLLAYAYYVKYDQWLVSEEWTFLACVTLGASHALSFLVTKWSGAARAWITTNTAKSIQEADCIRIVPPYSPRPGGTSYQRDTYVIQSLEPLVFARLPYPSSGRPTLSTFLQPKGLPAADLPNLLSLFGANEFNIPIPSFTELFGEHATAPFFVFQIFCVALWCLDEYWYYSLFTLFMLVMFECTVVWQRVRTLTEFRTMSVAPYPIQCYRDKKWQEVQTDKLLPGDVISLAPKQNELIVPADVLLVHGTCIVNEAMLSGESTPLLKESIQLLEASDRLDVDGAHKNAVLFSGTKVLQASAISQNGIAAPLKTSDGGCLGVVLRTGFGTAQGQLVRTMIFSTERVSANNLESFLFIGFLLIFAIAASWYVWTKGIERDLKKSKLLLDCVLIITSVVPPELPMELSLAVNASLVALSKFAIFCTEPFRIPFAGRVDVCCFDKTGTITAENLVLEGVVGVDPSDHRKLVDVKATSRETTLCLAAAHALVRLDDGTIVGDPMEKTTLAALDWDLAKGEQVSPANAAAPHKTQLSIRRRFQFSSALKRMSTVSNLPGGKTIAAVKGAPETIKGMLANVPAHYDDTYKYFTRKGSRVLALAMKEMEPMSVDRINKLPRDAVESQLTFAGFLVFHCPLKADAIETLQMLADSSHRCVMITGDNPPDGGPQNPAHEGDLTWRTVDESKVIPVDPSEPLDTSLFEEYDICITGAAMKQFANRPAWKDLVQNTWVYARVSPAQKEYILTSLKELGYTTLMAGDGTNDVGALKQAHIGVALLDGTPEDLQKIAERQRLERIKKVYESQLSISARFNQPPPPVPAAIAHLIPDAVAAQQRAAADLATARKKNPMERFNLEAITSKMADLDDEEEVPKIKLGDASCAAPFTSKLSHVAAVTHIIRQGRCTSCCDDSDYLDGIKFGDYQYTITGVMMSVCFLCISRAKPVEKLSRERPLGNIFNLYVFLSIVLQFALHIVTLVYMTNLAHLYEPREGPIDLEAKFEPSLLNTAIYLLGLSQQVSTFTINFQGRPFREGIRENQYLYWGLVGASAVAFSGATDFMPELNRWLQIVEMAGSFKVRLTASMIIDFAGCWVIEKVCKHLFADLEPKPMVTRGRERREMRRAEQERLRIAKEAEQGSEKKEQ